MGKIILIASGKGGVGKTLITTNLGASLSNLGKKVIMIDMNIGLRNIDLYMGFENRVVFDIADALSGLCKPKRAMIQDKRFPNLYIMAAPQEKAKFYAVADKLPAFYDELRNEFDVILIDGPAGINQELRISAENADMALLVLTLERISIRDAERVDHLLSEIGPAKRAYILNKVNQEFMRKGILPTFDDVSAMLRIPMLGIVQHDDNLYLAANSGVPLVYYKGNYVEENFKNIAERLITMLDAKLEMPRRRMRG